MKRRLGIRTLAVLIPALVAAACDGGGGSTTTTPAPTLTAQTINFPSPGTQTLGTAPAALAATASSGLTVSFASESTAVCTVSGTTLTLVAAGTCSITASQPGNSTYAAAPSITDNFTVNPAPALTAQTINFPTPAAETVGQTATIAATASSGLPVTFASNTTGICTVSGTTVTPLAAGTCSITASQAGNATYAAAPSITDTFTVNAAANPPTLVFETGFTNGALTVDGGATGGYGGSDQITAGCNGGQFCGGASAANSSNATSSEYYYIQSPSPSTGFQYVGLFVQAPNVTAISTTANTPGVQINGQNTVNFTFNQNPEWASQTTANGGHTILVILTLGNFYNVGTVAAPQPCNMKLEAVITPTGGAASTPYSVPISQFAVAQNCGVAAASSATAALAASVGGPVAQFDVQGDSGTSAITINGVTSSANTTVATGGYYPTTVSLTGPITFSYTPSTPKLVFATGFTNGALTVDGGATGGYGGSDQITAGCNGGQFCGGASAANSSNATSSEYYYIQSPSPSTGFQYVGLFVQAPNVTAISTTANTPGVQINGQTGVTFSFNQNPEWASQTTANGGHNILVILTLGNFYNVGTVAAPQPCNMKLEAVITPTGGAASTSYTVPFSQFSVAQNCGVTAASSAAAALAASVGGPVAQFDVQGDSGTSAITINGATSSANTSVATGGYYPTTVSLTGPITFQ